MATALHPHWPGLDGQSIPGNLLESLLLLPPTQTHSHTDLGVPDGEVSLGAWLAGLLQSLQ